jgi:hypothetical protein
VSDSRKEFTLSLNQNNPSDENPVLFKDINDELTKLLNDILREKFNDIDQQFTDKKNSIVEKLPHLAEYVKNIKNLTLPEAKMIEQAEKSFLSRRKEVKKEVEAFIKKINVKDFNEQKFNEVKNDFTNVGKEILADYIGYRETLIAMLLEILPKNREKDIHNLFMPQYTSSSDGNKYANNVWIFDDKFMNYNYAASDQTIQKIANNVNGVATDVPNDEANIRPDLIMFYSDNENNYKDVLLIEFKKLGASIDNKEKAINQLNKYPMYIRDNVKKIGNIYAYTIIDLDDTFIKILKDVNGFVDNAFGDSEGKISAYYRYNPNIKAHINVVSFSQVLNDASKRNKVFLDILINKFKNENN